MDFDNQCRGIHNLAPYSQFQNLGYDPAYVMFSVNQGTPGRKKDTVVNIEETGEFVYNMATYDLRDAVNRSAAEVPPEVDGSTWGPDQSTFHPGDAVQGGRSPVQFECIHYQTVLLPGKKGIGAADVIVGRVVLIHSKMT